MKSDDKVTLLGRHADIMHNIYNRINNVHKRPLHKGQITVARDYFVRGMRVVQSQWARDGGKTEAILFIATVAAILNDKFWVMIVAPEIKQGKKIYWHKKRLQNYPPPEYVKQGKFGLNVTDLKQEYENDSIITIEGCENFESLRGAKPDLVLYDEFQLHSEEFHLEVMQPNLLSATIALMIFGTPPKNRNAYYVKFREQLLKQIAEGATDKSYYEFDTYINPIHDHKILAERRKELFESGNEVIWYREYEAKLVFGGEDSVFPKWNPVVHCRTHKVVMSYLENDKHKLKWYTICDPGTASCFAVMFACYNPYTQQIFILDEIYEKDRNRTDSKQIWERIRKKEEELYPHSKQRDWKRIYDEQAAWFHREVVANNKHLGELISLAPSRKRHTSEEDDISNIKMLMAQPNALIVSDRCYWLRWEIESFITDAEGRFPDKHNHLVDDFKYLMQACNWHLIEKADVVLENKPKSQRKEIPVEIEPREWADNVVENSLNVDAKDIYADYFNFY